MRGTKKQPSSFSKISDPQPLAMGKSPNANQRLVFILLPTTHAVSNKHVLFNIHQGTLLQYIWSVEQITQSGHRGA